MHGSTVPLLPAAPDTIVMHAAAGSSSGKMGCMRIAALPLLFTYSSTLPLLATPTFAVTVGSPPPATVTVAALLLTVDESNSAIGNGQSKVGSSGSMSSKSKIPSASVSLLLGSVPSYGST